LEVDVLTARLNVLNELARINSLRREIARQIAELLLLVGLPVGELELRLKDEPREFDLPPERAVEIGLLRSTPIAQQRAEVFEQQRRANQTVWDWFPGNGPGRRLSR
jgi:outer membrane protein TolC